VFLVSPAGALLEFANTAEADRELRMMASALRKFDPAAPIEPPGAETAARPLPAPPEGGLIVAVTSKVLGGYEGAAPDRRAAIHAASIGRDHLWVRKDEAELLAAGSFPESLALRLARFHLIDNTRGEPPLWRPDEVRRAEIALERGRAAGSVHLQTAAGDRGYQATLLGFVEARTGKIEKLDLVTRGEFWGEGPFTWGAPKGRFPFAVAFTLVKEPTEVERVVPGAARNGVASYLR